MMSISAIWPSFTGIILLLAATHWLGFSLLAQKPATSVDPTLIPRSAEERDAQYRWEHRITLEVQVNDAAGHELQGLGPGDFTVLDNGKTQTLVGFRELNAATVQPHVLIVLDAVNNGAAFLHRAKKDIERFLSSDRADLFYPLGFILLGVSGTVRSETAKDREALKGRLDQITKNVRFSDCEVEGSRFDAVPGRGIDSEEANSNIRRSKIADCISSRSVQSINALRSIVAEEKNVFGPAIIVWLGAGWPLLVDSGPGHTPNYEDMLVELVTNLRLNQVTLGASSYGSFEKPRDVRQPNLNLFPSGNLTPDQSAGLKLSLPDLAGLTDGTVLERNKNLAPLLADCFREFDDYYSLAFQSPPSRVQDEAHTISVRIRTPGAKVRSMSMYFAQP